ncbi:MAG TPA: AfsR/SARP family transcriptional regulator [Acidimicrobiales bacterium]|jgi:DNA-binding SARP family transcriptional activator|nr:AfsR/SARP family transcriptional regulator [Acidimicrobiales bacterium]
MLYFRMLGKLEIQGRWTVAEPATPKIAGVLALFLCCPNQIVSTSAIMEDLWGEHAPKSASATTHTYIYRLRRLLQELDPIDCTEDFPLETRAPGYVLHVDEAQVDAFEFTRWAEEGRRLGEQGLVDEAVVALHRAIHLWRGQALTNVTCGQVVQAHVAHLHESFIRTRELHIQAMFELGRHDEMISELTMLAAKHPLNEWIHGRLMEALFSCGRRSDAQMIYRRIRARLAEELGIDPSPDLQQLVATAPDEPHRLPDPVVQSHTDAS